MLKFPEEKEQRPDTRNCVVQRILDGMKECEETGIRGRAKLSRRNRELQEVRQIRQTITVYRFEGTEKQFVFNGRFSAVGFRLSNKLNTMGVSSAAWVISYLASKAVLYKTSS